LHNRLRHSEGFILVSLRHPFNSFPVTFYRETFLSSLITELEVWSWSCTWIWFLTLMVRQRTCIQFSTCSILRISDPMFNDPCNIITNGWHLLIKRFDCKVLINLIDRPFKLRLLLKIDSCSYVRVYFLAELINLNL